MFDVGFSEMLVIGIVALVVIGPERLPKVARTLGVLFGRMQRYVTQVKADINRELEAVELGKVKSEFESAARSLKTEVEAHAADAERSVREVQEAIDRDLAATATGNAAETAPAPQPQEPPPAEVSPQLELGIEASPQLELGIEAPPQPGAPERKP